MNKKIFLTSIAIILAVVLLSIIFYFSKIKPDDTGIILFYGDSCPHCEIVDNFISENGIREKVLFSELEVSSNADNANILFQKASICKINQNEVGVPFLWDGENCFLGDVDVINFFQGKISENNI